MFHLGTQRDTDELFMENLEFVTRSFYQELQRPVQTSKIKNSNFTLHFTGKQICLY